MAGMDDDSSTMTNKCPFKFYSDDKTGLVLVKAKDASSKAWSVFGYCHPASKAQIKLNWKANLHLITPPTSPWTIA